MGRDKVERNDNMKGKKSKENSFKNRFKFIFLRKSKLNKYRDKRGDISSAARFEKEVARYYEDEKGYEMVKKPKHTISIPDRLKAEKLEEAIWDDYGKPDLVAVDKNKENKFIEVKGGTGRLKENQIRWILSHLDDFSVDAVFAGDYEGELTLSVESVGGVDIVERGLEELIEDRKELVEEINQIKRDIKELKSEKEKLKEKTRNLNIPKRVGNAIEELDKLRLNSLKEDIPNRFRKSERPTTLYFLDSIRKNGSLSKDEFIEMSNLNKSTIWNHFERYYRLGFIEKRYGNRFKLTEQGKKRVNYLKNQVEEYREEKEEE